MPPSYGNSRRRDETEPKLAKIARSIRIKQIFRRSWYEILGPILAMYILNGSVNDWMVLIRNVFGNGASGTSAARRLNKLDRRH